MTLMEAFGSGCLAFGPAFAIFALTIARDPLRIIILFISGIIWLVSLFASSLLWLFMALIFPALSNSGRQTSKWNGLYFGVIVSVLLQECARCCLFGLLQKAEPGLQQFASDSSMYHSRSFSKRRSALYFDAGLGFGIMSSIFMLVSVLNAASGPGTVGLFNTEKSTSYFFFVSAALALCIVLLHACWGVITHAALQRRQYIPLALVVLDHLLVSLSTFCIQLGLFGISIGIALSSLVACAVLAYFMIGGSLASFRRCLFGPALPITNSTASVVEN